jgi:hypothetical protein
MKEAGKNGTIRGVLSQGGERELLLEDVELVHAATDGDQQIGAPVSFFAAPAPSVRVAHKRTGILGQFPGISAGDPDWQYVPAHDCCGQCGVVNVSLDGEDDGHAYAGGGGCVGMHTRCPDWNEPGIFDAERGPGREMEPYEGSDPPARLKRYGLYYYFAVEVFKTRGAGRRVCLPKCVVTVIRTKYPNRKGTAYQTIGGITM